MSTPAYDIYVLFKEDYENIKKGSLRFAIRYTDNPGTGMGFVSEPSKYKIWFDVFDDGITEKDMKPFHLLNRTYVPSEYVYEIWDIKEYRILIRKHKLERILNDNN